MRKYGESKTTRIMMATVSHVTSSLGLSGRWIFVGQSVPGFRGVCGFHLHCSPGRLVLVISQKTVVFCGQVFFLGKTVKILLYKNRISDLVDALKLSNEQKMDIAICMNHSLSV